jgi:hypothetical protein
MVPGVATTSPWPMRWPRRGRLPIWPVPRQPGGPAVGAWTQRLGGTTLMHLEGAPLCHQVPGRAGWELRLVVPAVCASLERIRRMDHATLTQRPARGGPGLPRPACGAPRASAVFAHDTGSSTCRTRPPAAARRSTTRFCSCPPRAAPPSPPSMPSAERSTTWWTRWPTRRSRRFQAAVVARPKSAGVLPAAHAPGDAGADAAGGGLRHPGRHTCTP